MKTFEYTDNTLIWLQLVAFFIEKTSKVFKLFADPKVWRKQLRLLPEEALGAQPASCVSMLCLCACLCVCVLPSLQILG